MPYLSCGGSISSEPTTGIYGVEWSGTSQTSWLRTDDAALFVDPNPAVNNGNGSSPFDDIMPWAGMERVEDTNAGTLVKIPKFWYKWTRENASMKLQIANYAADGFLVSPAHADRGDGKGERDYVYVGAYHCDTSTWKSISGVKPMVSTAKADFRTNIHSLGTDIWIWDFAMYWTVCMLYLVEYANWNSQEKVGYGGTGANYTIENSGICDSMTYHTGTNAATLQTYGHTRYRYIEDLWGNCCDIVDGIYCSGTNIFCTKNPAQFSDNSGGTNVGGVRASATGWITSYTIPTAPGFEYALFPTSTVGESQSAGGYYVGDYYNYNESRQGIIVGGIPQQNQQNGLFRLFSNDVLGNNNSSSRLMKLP